MIKITTTYKTKGTQLIRVMNDDSNIPMIIGEMLHGIQVQDYSFDVNNTFKSFNIPTSFTKNTTIVDNDEWKITIARLIKK